MTRNIGTLDRFCASSWGSCLSRISICADNWGRLGLIPLATAFAGFCPIYRLLGLSISRHRLSAP